MKYFALAALLAAFSLPVAVSAQQAQQPYPPPQGSQGYGQPPSATRGFNRWMRLLQPLGLSGQQQQQVEGILTQYIQAHPPGSAPDPQGKRALMQQVFTVLTPQQQDQLRQEMQQMKVQRLQRQLQQAQQEGQGAPQQGAPPQGQPQGQPPR